MQVVLKLVVEVVVVVVVIVVIVAIIAAAAVVVVPNACSHSSTNYTWFCNVFVISC